MGRPTHVLDPERGLLQIDFRPVSCLWPELFRYHITTHGTDSMQTINTE